MSGLKKSNDYALQLSEYDRTPKAVLAAVAVSALTCGGDYLSEANDKVLDEWWALYNAKIVPQKPPVARPSLSATSNPTGEK